MPEFVITLPGAKLAERGRPIVGFLKQSKYPGIVKTGIRMGVEHVTENETVVDGSSRKLVPGHDYIVSVSAEDMPEGLSCISQWDLDSWIGGDEAIKWAVKDAPNKYVPPPEDEDFNHDLQLPTAEATSAELKVYVINLPRSTRRREHMRELLGQYGIEPVWIAGGDRQEMQRMPENYSPEKAHAAIKRQMGTGEIGCLMGHLRAFQAIIDSGAEWGIVMEDDIALHRDPVKTLEAVIAMTGDDGVLVLGTSATKRRRVGIVHTEQISELERVPYGAYCYAIHRKMAGQAILHLAQSLHIPIDVYFRHACIARSASERYWQHTGISGLHPVGNSTVIGDEARMRGMQSHCWAKLEVDNICPALIHQIWLGLKPVPKETHSWKTFNPGRLYKLWTAKDMWAILKEYGMRDIWASYMSAGAYAYAADVARYCILHKLGGFYADADSNAMRAMDIDTPFLVYESEIHRPNLLCNGFFQLKAKHPLLLDVLKSISALEHPVKLDIGWELIGPGAFTKAAESYRIDKLPSSFFLPQHFHGENESAGVPSYCQHSWGSTHIVEHG